MDVWITRAIQALRTDQPRLAALYMARGLAVGSTPVLP